jgi:hypothetical protein
MASPPARSEMMTMEASPSSEYRTGGVDYIHKPTRMPTEKLVSMPDGRKILLFLSLSIEDVFNPFQRIIVPGVVLKENYYRTSDGHSVSRLEPVSPREYGHVKAIVRNAMHHDQLFAYYAERPMVFCKEMDIRGFNSLNEK